MGRVKKANQEMLKKLNRQMVLNYIRKNNMVSRAELTEYTKLSPTTVSLITSELIEKNLVLELGIGESSGGRRPVMLGINPNARYAISVILKPKGAICALVDLECNIVEEYDIKCPIKGTHSVTTVLRQCIEDIFNTYGDIKYNIAGVGISAPGIIGEDGCILYSAPLNVKDFDIVEVLKAEVYDMDYFVFKDTDALILGEYNFGIGKKYRNFAYIMVEDGVGMSYIKDGKLFRPSSMGGFELGHMTIDLDGPICRCGNRGCLGTTISEDYIVEKYKTMSHSKNEEFRLIDIVSLSNNGDDIARHVLEEQAKILGIGIANILNMLNPELIVIGGPLNRCTWDYLSIVLEIGRNTALNIYKDDVDIKYTTLGNQSALMGMANDVFEKKIFSPIEF